MAMEKPVIGTAVGGVGEVIEDGRNGYLVEPDNASALAGSIITMLKDRERARAMGKEGRRMVLERFTVERMCEGIHALYLSLLREKNR
jgi:trehalose synthase